MGFGAYVVSLMFLLIGSLQYERQTENEYQTGDTEVYALARQILMVSNAIGHYRYNHDGTPNIPPSWDGLPGISFKPDSRIKWVIKDDRAWVWAPYEIGLMDAMQKYSRHSHLLGRAKNGAFIYSDGKPSGLSVPENTPEDAIVYLN